MKPYSASQGFTPFDWESFLNNDIESISPAQWERAKQLAHDWKTCPVANLPDNIERDESGRPKDDKLRMLGSRFSGKIAKCKEYCEDIKSRDIMKHLVNGFKENHGQAVILNIDGAKDIFRMIQQVA